MTTDRAPELIWKFLVLVVLAIAALVIKFLRWALPEQVGIFIYHSRLRLRVFWRRWW